MTPAAVGEFVNFVPETTLRSRVAASFERHQSHLAALLPDAEIQHVGSTAVPGSLTKGDLDIQVRVPASQFAQADAILGHHYRRNVASAHTQTFASFKDDGADLPLGIQLTAIDGPEDFFCVLRDYLVAHRDTNERYNDLKRQFEGAVMDDYRAAKSTFLETLLAQLHSKGAPNSMTTFPDSLP